MQIFLQFFFAEGPNFDTLDPNSVTLIDPTYEETTFSASGLVKLVHHFDLFLVLGSTGKHHQENWYLLNISPNTVGW